MDKTSSLGFEESFILLSKHRCGTETVRGDMLTQDDDLAREHLHHHQGTNLLNVAK